VITEYGAAELHGKTVLERSRALAMIGHPDFRDELLAQAEVWPCD
jgi:acyl-CoA hydrolase